jgi:hypothetical protein
MCHPNKIRSRQFAWLASVGMSNFAKKDGTISGWINDWPLHKNIAAR